MAVLKQVLTRPMGRKMELDSSRRAHDTGADFEQANANGVRTGLRQDGISQDRSAKVRHQQCRDRVQLKPDRIGTKAVTAQAIRIHPEF